MLLSGYACSRNPFPQGCMVAWNHLLSYPGSLESYKARPGRFLNPHYLIFPNGQNLGAYGYRHFPHLMQAWRLTLSQHSQLEPPPAMLCLPFELFLKIF